MASDVGSFGVGRYDPDKIPRHLRKWYETKQCAVCGREFSRKLSKRDYKTCGSICAREHADMLNKAKDRRVYRARYYHRNRSEILKKRRERYRDG